MKFRELKADRARVRHPDRRLSARVEDLAEAGAAGHMLTPGEVKKVCEALRSQANRVRTQFHSAT